MAWLDSFEDHHRYMDRRYDLRNKDDLTGHAVLQRVNDTVRERDHAELPFGMATMDSEALAWRIAPLIADLRQRHQVDILQNLWGCARREYARQQDWLRLFGSNALLRRIFGSLMLGVDMSEVTVRTRESIAAAIIKAFAMTAQAVDRGQRAA